MLLKHLNTLVRSLIVLISSIFFLFQLNIASGSVRFIPAGHLGKGMRLLTNDGKIITVQSIEQKDKQAVMYNLTVNNDHNYFINSWDKKSGILVHNCPKGQFSENALINLQRTEKGRYFVGVIDTESGLIDLSTSTRIMKEIQISEDGFLHGKIIEKETTRLNKLANGEYLPVKRFTANPTGAPGPGHMIILSRLLEVDPETQGFGAIERLRISNDNIFRKYGGFGGILIDGDKKIINLTWDSRSLNIKLNPQSRSYQLPSAYQAMVRDAFTERGYNIFHGTIESTRM